MTWSRLGPTPIPAYILTGIKRSQQISKFATTSFIKAANCHLLYALSIDYLDFDATFTALAGAPRASNIYCHVTSMFLRSARF